MSIAFPLRDIHDDKLEAKSAIGTFHFVPRGANPGFSDICVKPSAVGTIHVCRDGDAQSTMYESRLLTIKLSAVGPSHFVPRGANPGFSDNCVKPSAVGTIHVCRDGDALSTMHER